MRKFLLLIFIFFVVFSAPLIGQSCPSGQNLETLVFNLTGQSSYDSYNDSDNYGVTMNATSSGTVIGASFQNINFNTVSGSYCDEAQIDISDTPNAFTNYYTHQPSNQGSSGPCSDLPSSSGFIDFVAAGDDFPTGSNGEVYLELWESYDDTPNSQDANYTSGTVTVYVCVTAAMPINFSKLYAKKESKFNHVYWSTSSEINNDIQQVERSIDGISNWEMVGKVAGTNTNSEQTYQVKDDKPFQKSYYRIKSIDFDGKIQLSDIVSVFRDGEKGSIDRIHPNPTFNNLQIDFEPLYDDELTYAVYNADGKLMKSFIFQGISGKSNTHLLDISSLNTGFYFVKIKGGGINHYAKIFKI